MKIPKKPTRDMIQAGCMELKDILSETLEDPSSPLNEDAYEYVKRIYERMIESIEENGE